MSRLREFGERLAEIQDQVLREDDCLEEVRQRLFNDVAPHSSWSRRALLAATALAAGIAVAAAIILTSTPRPLTVTVGESTRDFEVGAWIAASPSNSLPIRFSDGSAVHLDPLSGARITSIDARGARVLLERGSAKVKIVPRKDADWRLDVGPFSVRVTGTQFYVAWSPSREIFVLRMSAGSVLVRGPIVEQGRRLLAGETFSAWVGENRMEVMSSGEAETDSAPAGIVAPEASTDTERTEPVEPTFSSSDIERASPKSTTADSPSWQSLAGEGRYNEALHTAEKIGIGLVLARSSEADVMLLGDAARLAGRLGHATRAYKTARRRYPGSDSASMAAFSLGRMAFDQQHNFGQSSKWLEIYLDERPGGSLEREAMGRLIEAHTRAGDTTRASAVARRYLTRYPRGPHANFAKKALTGTREGGL